MARGFTPDSGATWLLPRRVGPARARELLLLGRELTGTEAAEWGVAHRAVPAPEVFDQAAALPCLPGPGMIYQNLSHQVCGDAEKMRPIPPAGLFLRNQSQVCLIHQGRRLQSVVGPLPPHVTCGQAVKMVVNQTDELRLRFRIPTPELNP